MEELAARGEDLGFTVLMIDRKRMLSATREIMAEKGCRVPVLVDSHRYSRSVLGAMYTPTLFVIDPEGRLRARLVGYSEDLPGIVEDTIARLSGIE